MQELSLQPFGDEATIDFLPDSFVGLDDCVLALEEKRGRIERIARGADHSETALLYGAPISDFAIGKDCIYVLSEESLARIHQGQETAKLKVKYGFSITALHPYVLVDAIEKLYLIKDDRSGLKLIDYVELESRNDIEQLGDGAFMTFIPMGREAVTVPLRKDEARQLLEESELQQGHYEAYALLYNELLPMAISDSGIICKPRVEFSEYRDDNDEPLSGIITDGIIPYIIDWETPEACKIYCLQGNQKTRFAYIEEPAIACGRSIPPYAAFTPSRDAPIWFFGGGKHLGQAQLDRPADMTTGSNGHLDVFRGNLKCGKVQSYRISGIDGI